jgi:hypothetical protein
MGATSIADLGVLGYLEDRYFDEGTSSSREEEIGAMDEFFDSWWSLAVLILLVCLLAHASAKKGLQVDDLRMKAKAKTTNAKGKKTKSIKEQ